MLIETKKNKAVEGLSPNQVVRVEQEMDALQRESKLAEESYGNEVLNLDLARGYLAKLVGNARVVRYLTQHYPVIVHELQAISEALLPDAAVPNPSA
jgi:hypothetical protein